jgi:hypothetical protein
MAAGPREVPINGGESFPVEPLDHRIVGEAAQRHDVARSIQRHRNFLSQDQEDDRE